MSTERTARDIADPANDLGGRFMLDGATYARGAELGFSGMDFYFRGRAGVLGEVDAATVTAEMGFFQPGTVAANWDTARDVMSAGEAATAVVVKAGNGTAEFFGWAAPHPDPEPARATWQAAEDATDEQVAATLAVLDETEQATLVRLLTGAA